MADKHCPHVGVALGQLKDPAGDQSGIVEQLRRFVTEDVLDGDEPWTWS
jgi:hypothetical protein